MRRFFALILLTPLALAGCQRSVSGAAAGASQSNASCSAAAAPAAASSLADTPIENPLVTFDSAWAIIARTHWDTTYNGVNWRALRDTLRPRAAAAKTTGELRGIMSEMIGRLKQSHFSIIPRELSDVTPGAASGESSTTQDRSGGVGVTIRYVDKALLVTKVREGSSADRAGVKAGYQLEAVAGCPFAPRLARIPKTMEPRRVALSGYSMGTQALLGPVGDTVRATFRDGRGKSLEVALEREKEPGSIVKFGNLPPMPAALEYEQRQVGDRKIGIIRFNIWMLVLAPEFDKAMDELRGSDAIILDLRGNPGGVGGMSMGVAGHFFDSAKVLGVMRQRAGDLRFLANPRRVDRQNRLVQPFSGPLALVVDEISVSTTEIFAGGLQEQGRARVFGTQTAGQALPSVAERLPNQDILYHAIADFLSPKGRQIEGLGVVPDEAAPVTRKALLEGKDPALDAALAWVLKQPRGPRS